MGICGLEEAKEIVQKLVAWFNLGNKSTTLNPEEFEAIVMVSQELDRLQKENEKLKEIDLTTVHIKGVCDEKERWRNKIREKIEEIIENEEGYAMELQAKIDILNHLLKEE